MSPKLIYKKKSEVFKMKKGFYEAALKAKRNGEEFWFFSLDGRLYEVCGGYTELSTDKNGVTLGIIDTTDGSNYKYVSCKDGWDFIPEFKKTLMTKKLEENKKFEYCGNEFEAIAYGCPVDGVEMPEEILNGHINSFLKNVLSHKYEERDPEFVKEFGRVFRNFCNRHGYLMIDTVGETFDYDYEMLDMALEFFEEEGAQGFINMFKKGEEN